MMELRVRRRILIAAVLPAVVVAVALAGIMLKRQYGSLDEALQARALAEARQLASASEFSVFAGSVDTLEVLARATRDGDPDIVAVAVLDARGLPLATGGTTMLVKAPTLSPKEGVVQDGGVTIVVAPIHHATLPVDDIYSGRKPSDAVAEVTGFVVLEMSRKSLDAERNRQLVIGMAVALAGLVLAGILAGGIALGVTRPVLRIGKVVERIGQGDLTARVEPDRAAVMPGLEAGINGMARRLGLAHEHLVQQIEAATAELRERTNEAENANVAKMRFLAAASHDLRQPIHAQGLFLDVLARTELTADQRQLITSVRASADASAEMLNTLLDFSRIEAGVVHPKIRPFHLQPMLDKIEGEFASLAMAKGLVFRSRETMAAVQSDPALVELIARNLVSNAIRYTEKGGVLLACRTRGGEVWLEVWDTGIGIAPEQQHEVFREFYQLDNPERDRRKGLGLGLAIADGLARTMGHRLSLASTRGCGSMFRLTLPAAHVAVACGGETDTVQSNSFAFHASVLVIDDDEAVRSGMARLLGDWGCECVAVGSIEEALAAAQRRRPDVVISDFRLREQRTGAEAIAALRAKFDADLPALLITGDTAPDRLRESLASNVPLLHKPVSPGMLHQRLVELLST